MHTLLFYKYTVNPYPALALKLDTKFSSDALLHHVPAKCDKNCFHKSVILFSTRFSTASGTAVLNVKLGASV